MPFLIETWDKPDHVHVRNSVRPAHVEYLISNQTKLLAAGAKLADDGETALGTLYLVDTDSRAEAERFAAEDPFTKAGLPGRLVVTRWRKAFFHFENTMPKL
jgi:uncharacterized protein YciI